MISKTIHSRGVVAALLAVGLGMPVVSNAAAFTSIDFETVTSLTDSAYTDVHVPAGYQLPHPNGGGVLDKGFTYSPGPQFGSDPYDLHIANQITATDPTTGVMYPYDGTTIAGAHHSSILARADGGVFSLYGFDYAGYAANGQVYEVPVTVTGTQKSGQVLTQTFQPDGIVDGIGGQPDFQNFCIGCRQEMTWNDLVSVTFAIDDPTGSLTAATQGSFAVDNITVSSVPEPASVLLFGVGMLGLAWFQRKSILRG